MPYFLQKKGSQTCVVNGSASDPGAVVKCHAKRQDAVDQLRALYKNVPDAKKTKKPAMKKDAYIVGDETPELFIPTTNGTITVTGFATGANTPPTTAKQGSRVRLFFSEGEQTPDGRFINTGAINSDRPPPYAFRLQLRQPESGGHAGAELAGVLTSIVRKDNTLIIEGPLDMGSAAGREAERLMREGFLQTWSPDLGDIVWDEEVTEMDAEGNPTRSVAHVVSGVFLGGTACAIPALASAVMELLDDEGNVISPAPQRLSLVACGDLVAPPAEFFTNPNLTELQRWTTITPEGRVYGHAAAFGECHIGHQGRCITIDMIADCRGEGNFEYAMPGHVVTSEGTQIGTGPIPIKGGHADKSLGWKQALSYYDNTDSTVADVCYFMDKFGVAFSGAIRPTATQEQIYVLRASGVSLDAREVDGQLRYLLTCCVNSGGLPKLGIRLAASAETEEPHVLTLIAAGGAPVPNLSNSLITPCADCEDCASDDEDALFNDLADRLIASLELTLPTPV